MRYLLALLAVSFFFCSSPNSPAPTPIPLIDFVIISPKTNVDYVRAKEMKDSNLIDKTSWYMIFNGAEYETEMKLNDTIIVRVADNAMLTVKRYEIQWGRFFEIDSHVAHADSTWFIKQ